MLYMYMYIICMDVSVECRTESHRTKGHNWHFSIKSQFAIWKKSTLIRPIFKLFFFNWYMTKLCLIYEMCVNSFSLKKITFSLNLNFLSNLYTNKNDKYLRMWIFVKKYYLLLFRIQVMCIVTFYCYYIFNPKY
jgi:hypothetical protein